MDRMPADDALLNQALTDYQNQQFDAAQTRIATLPGPGKSPSRCVDPGRHDPQGPAATSTGARQAYRQAMACDARYVDAYSNLANLERGEGLPENALPLYEQAFALSPTANAANNVGCVLADLGRRRSPGLA